MATDADIEKVIREYLPTIVHMSLATVSGDAPWVCEVHFVYDEQLNLYFRSLKTRRHSQEVAVHPKVAGTIVRQHGLGEVPLGVYFEGAARQLTTEDERQAVFGLFKDRLGVSEEVLEEARKDTGHQFYKVTIDSYYVFGKIGDAPAQKYQLKRGGGV